MRHFIVVSILSLLVAAPSFGKVKIKLKDKMPQTEYAASRLNGMNGDFTISISVTGSGPAEGFSLSRTDKEISIIGNDGPGAIYGANRLLEEWQQDRTLQSLPTVITDQPQMVMRGACVGLQKRNTCLAIASTSTPIRPRTFPGSTTRSSGFATSTCWHPAT